MGKWVFAMLLALVLGVGLAHAGNVYKWVDAQGNVHYSDHPHPGAMLVALPKTQTYVPPDSKGMPVPRPHTAPASPIGGYTQFSIASPGRHANLWYVHKVTISVSLTPQLRPGDTLTYHLDGRTIGPTARQAVTFRHVYRGTHTASVTLNARQGATRSAGPVTFYVHQKSILGPKPPI